jgi:site-specific recombinase XerD
MSNKTLELLRRERMEATVSELIERFLITKQTENCTAKTIDWYRQMLGRFARFVGEDTRMSSLGLDDARRFVTSLQAQQNRYENHNIAQVKEGGLSPYTISCYVRPLKTFSRWLVIEGYCRIDPFDRLKKPKLPQPMIEVLTNDEVKEMLSAINPNTFTGSRLYTMILLLLDTGIRASELTGLQVENADLTNGAIKVLGKGRKERIVYFGAVTKKAMLRYFTSFRPESISDKFFLTTDGRELTYNSLKLIIQRLAERSGIQRLHLHLLRHTFAVNYLLNGGDLMTLRLMLGHTTISTTQIYLNLSSAQVQLQHNRFSPVDRLGITSGRSGKRVARTG